MKTSILILLSILLLGCDTSNTSVSQTAKNTVDSQDIDNTKSLNQTNYTQPIDTNPKSLNKNFSAQDTIQSLKNSNDNRKLVYLIHPDEEIIAYCYQAQRSECYIKGIVNGCYFEHDITAIENKNIGGITINKVQSARTTPTKWIDLTNEYLAINMETKVTMDSKIYTYHDYLIINFDERGVFWQ